MARKTKADVGTDGGDLDESSLVLNNLKPALETLPNKIFGVNNSSFWLGTTDEVSSLKQAVESVVRDFSYYPEMEWDRYGFRPPEGRPFYGAWRNVDRTAFVYLVGENDATQEIKMLLIVTAQGEERLTNLVARFQAVTESFRKAERQAVQRVKQDRFAAKFTQNYADKRVIGIYSLATAALAGASRALRTMPSPATQFERLNEIYDVMVMTVHLVSLFSLLLAGVFLVIFFARHIVGIMRQA